MNDKTFYGAFFVIMFIYMLVVIGVLAGVGYFVWSHV